MDHSAPSWKFVLRAFESRNYRLFFGGQIISLIGNWLTTLATSWLVYRLSSARGHTAAESAFILGLVAFAGQIPQLFITPIAGVWVDRLNRHRVLIATQTLAMLQSFSLAFLAYHESISIEWIIALNAFQGFIDSFDAPTRQAFTVSMVEKKHDLSNAIALNSSMIHASRLIGPALAGYLIYRFGVKLCFLMDGMSYLAVILALFAMRFKDHSHHQHPPGHVHEPPLHAFKTGLRYVSSMPTIRALLILNTVTSLFFMVLQVFMPILASDILGGGERTYGFLLGSSGLGAFLSTLYLAARRSVVGLSNVIAYSHFALSFGLIGMTFMHWRPLCMLVLVITGFALTAQVAASSTIVQTLVDNEKRGRIMSLFSVSFLGIMPLGGLLSGVMAKTVGVKMAYATAGIGCLMSAIIFFLYLPHFRKATRPHYEKLGILPKKES